MMEQYIEESRRLIDYIAKSPSVYHSVDNAAAMLSDAGFEELFPSGTWNGIRVGGRYFVRYNNSALIAYTVPDDLAGSGFRMIASHSDSPCLRIKPNSMHTAPGSVVELNTEVYGGAILYSWMDRPLSLAGRVLFRGDSVLRPRQVLVDFKEPVGVIPSVAIHFNRGVNESMSLSKQRDMQIVADVLSDSLGDALSIKQRIAENLGVCASDIVDFDLYTYDPTPGQFVGFDKSLLVAPKQDNLTMLFASVEAMLDAGDVDSGKMILIFDNEEVGSTTKQGAGSPFAKDVLRRICMHLGFNEEDYQRAVYNSFLVSADMAHAVHPNHPEKSDPILAPSLNQGPVIKYNANQKYMTDADGAAVFSCICRDAGVPCQLFANNSDVMGGSTLGNILTSQLNLRGVDVGNPLLAMHSSRETGGTKDALYLRRALLRFLQSV